jgi:hypothetical protein
MREREKEDVDPFVGFLPLLPHSNSFIYGLWFQGITHNLNIMEMNKRTFGWWSYL